MPVGHRVVKTMVDVIAIDGPTASGKGTVSARVAAKLGFHYLDSGALYRLCALRAMKSGGDLKNEAVCAEEARTMHPVFNDGRIVLDGADVTEAIRTLKTN